MMRLLQTIIEFRGRRAKKRFYREIGNIQLDSAVVRVLDGQGGLSSSQISGLFGFGKNIKQHELKARRAGIKAGLPEGVINAAILEGKSFGKEK